ncbi:hypothetical protein D3C86_918960 [compost metagenome]
MNRSANRNVRIRVYEAGGRDHCSFRRPVVVIQLITSGGTGFEPVSSRQQSCQRAVIELQEQLAELCRQKTERDALPFHIFVQMPNIGSHLLIHDVHGRSGEKRRE